MREPDLFGNTAKVIYNGLYAGDVDGKRNGEKCRDCAYKYPVTISRGTVYKCARMRHKWTFTVKTDICITRPACVYFEKAED